jgi:hypothetical protein
MQARSRACRCSLCSAPLFQAAILELSPTLAIHNYLVISRARVDYTCVAELAIADIAILKNKQSTRTEVKGSVIQNKWRKGWSS